MDVAILDQDITSPFNSDTIGPPRIPKARSGTGDFQMTKNQSITGTGGAVDGRIRTIPDQAVFDQDVRNGSLLRILCLIPVCKMNTGLTP